jgi:hypothetical protein
VTALAAVGPLLLAAEGPFVRFYHSQDSRQFNYLGSKTVFEDQAVHGISVQPNDSKNVTLAIWGGPLARFLHVGGAPWNIPLETQDLDSFELSPVTRAPDWLLDLSFGPTDSSDSDGRKTVCAAVTAHNALIKFTVQHSDSAGERSYVSSR